MKQNGSARHMNNWEQHAELSKKISIYRNSDLGRGNAVNWIFDVENNIQKTDTIL
jgi:hypothetical protein